MATLYLATASNGGSDSNNGTTALTPWLTFGKVQTSGTSGDTVYVIGHASETFTFATVQWNKAFTFRAYNLTEDREWQKGDSYPRPKITNDGVSLDYGWYMVGNVTLNMYNLWFDNIYCTYIFSQELNANFPNSRFRYYYCDFSRITLSGSYACLMNCSQAYPDGSSATDPVHWMVSCRLWDFGSPDGSGQVFQARYRGFIRMDNTTVYLKDKGSGLMVLRFWYLQAFGSGRVVINNCIVRIMRATEFTYSDTAATDTYLNVNGLAMNSLVATTYATNLPARVTTSADPLFISPDSHPANLNLRPDSPCIGTGSVI